MILNIKITLLHNDNFDVTFNKCIGVHACNACVKSYNASTS